MVLVLLPGEQAGRWRCSGALAAQQHQQQKAAGTQATGSNLSIGAENTARPSRRRCSAVPHSTPCYALGALGPHFIPLFLPLLFSPSLPESLNFYFLFITFLFSVSFSLCALTSTTSSFSPLQNYYDFCDFCCHPFNCQPGQLNYIKS